MTLTVKLIIGVSLLINVILIIWLWKESKSINPDNIQPLRDSIALIEKQRHELELKIVTKDKAYDSLKYIKQTIIIKYNDKVKFIYSANPDELDLIIKSAIK